MRPINKKNEVFEYIQKYIIENGYSPSIREICSACEIRSTATVYQYVKELDNEGVIIKGKRKNRAVALSQQSQYVDVPLIGTVAAGEPIFATENYEDTFSVPSNLFHGDDLFMLKVHGSSMIKVGIFEGDKIIVKKQQTADNGDIVVALVDDSATVKRFYRKNGKIILHPENDDMEDFIFEDVLILGKVIGLMRNL